jgi:hypothetical protein
MKINLHIERVVLDGLPVASHQRGLVLSALETELTRLLGAAGLSSELMSGGAVPYLPTSSIELTSGVGPAQIGRQIAGAVHRGIGGEGTRGRSAN